VRRSSPNRMPRKNSSSTVAGSTVLVSRTGPSTWSGRSRGALPRCSGSRPSALVRWVTAPDTMRAAATVARPPARTGQTFRRRGRSAPRVPASGAKVMSARTAPASATRPPNSHWPPGSCCTQGMKRTSSAAHPEPAAVTAASAARDQPTGRPRPGSRPRSVGTTSPMTTRAATSRPPPPVRTRPGTVATDGIGSGMSSTLTAASSTTTTPRPTHRGRRRAPERAPANAAPSSRSSWSRKRRSRASGSGSPRTSDTGSAMTAAPSRTAPTRRTAGKDPDSVAVCVTEPGVREPRRLRRARAAGAAPARAPRWCASLPTRGEVLAVGDQDRVQLVRRPAVGWPAGQEGVETHDGRCPVAPPGRV